MENPPVEYQQPLSTQKSEKMTWQAGCALVDLVAMTHPTWKPRHHRDRCQVTTRQTATSATLKMLKNFGCLGRRCRAATVSQWCVSPGDQREAHRYQALPSMSSVPTSWISLEPMEIHGVRPNGSHTEVLITQRTSDHPEKGSLM